MGDFALLTAGAASGVEHRQFVRSNMEVTSDMLGQLDLSDKSTRTCLILAVFIASLVLIIVFVITRLLVRRLMIGQFFLDDILLSIASAFTIGLCIVSLRATSFGFGQHVWNIPSATVIEDVKKCVQHMFIGNIFYVCAITFIKLSIIASYLRIFPYNTLRIAMYITAAVTMGLFVASVPATIFQCNPVSAAWDFTMDSSTFRCYTFINYLYASTAINITTDLVLCTAPLPYFWNLQLPRKQKIIVSSLFFIGGFACVASIVRLTFLNLLAAPLDITWDLAPSVLWTIAECTIGICCVSVPPMRPLFSRLLPDVVFVFPTRRTGDRTAADEAARRQAAYAMGGFWSSGAPGTPLTDEEENKFSDASDRGEEQVPKSWLGADECYRASMRGTAGRSATLTVREVEDVVSAPGG